jgi:carboxyl-terminal processing protease
MSRSVPRALLLLLLTAFGLAPLAAQTSITPAAASTEVTRVEDVLRQGRQYETGEQWGDALSYYEDALRNFPNDRNLRQRHDQARIQFDLGRRYHDASFRKSIETLSRRDALAIYNDVLLKIDSHYVHSPDWREIVGNGTASLDAALSKDLFVEQNLHGVDRKAVEAFRAEAQRVIAGRQVRDRTEARDAAGEIADLGQRRLGIAPAAVVLEFACGAAASLDSYSTYLTADQLRDVFAQIEGNFVGLGIEIKAVDGGLQLVNVIPGSPAAIAGLQADDRITTVDGKTTKGVTTDGAASLLQGEENSVCTLVYVRGKNTPRELRVRRAHVEVPSVENVKIVDRETGTGYLKVSSFQKTTPRDLDAALWQLNNDGMKSLVFDLRGNPGGLLTAAVEMADKFLVAGTIVSTRGRSSQEDFNYTAHRVGTWQVPLVVLVDGDSASASEIFAAAIQDNHRGTVVGRRSYGKGSVQGIFPISASAAIDNGGIRLTTAKFYGPSGRAISGAGVTPDVVVQKTGKPVAATGEVPQAAEDADLTAALQVLRRPVASR